MGHLSSSRTCLLPNMEYGDGKKAETIQLGANGPNENLEALKKANIGTTSHCKGGLLTLSFIAKEEGAIRCYLYYNGQMTRFMPKDIKVVFPKLFNMERKTIFGRKNQQFMNKANETTKKKLIDETIDRMNKVLKDKYFDAFRETCA